MLFFEDNVKNVLSDKAHLLPVFNNIYDIPQRLRDIDDTLFVVFNAKTQKFEVHSLEHKPETYAWEVPFEQLDVRTLRLARRNSLRMRGDEIFKEIDRNNERIEAGLARKRRNDLDAWARDVAYWHFKKTAYWE